MQYPYSFRVVGSLWSTELSLVMYHHYGYNSLRKVSFNQGDKTDYDRVRRSLYRLAEYYKRIILQIEQSGFLSVEIKTVLSRKM